MNRRYKTTDNAASGRARRRGLALANFGLEIVYPSRFVRTSVALLYAVGYAAGAILIVGLALFGWALAAALNTGQPQGHNYLTLMEWGGSIIGGIAFLLVFVCVYFDPDVRMPRLRPRSRR